LQILMSRESSLPLSEAPPLTAEAVAPLRAWIEVDLDAVRRNAERVAAHTGLPMIPMVKGDAYALGVLPIVRVLEPLAPHAYGVSVPAEGEELREAGISRKIILYTPCLPHELARARAAGLTPSLSSAEQIMAWAGLGGGAWHLVIDTGMHREGIAWDAVDTLRAVLTAHPPAGVYTHFHSADADAESIAQQESRFAQAVAALPSRPALVYADNSPAMARRATSPFGATRPGAFLYGLSGGPHAVIHPDSVVHVRARILELRWIEAGETVSYGATWRAPRRTRVATVAIGHADGWRRALSNWSDGLLHGRRVSMIGNVTMDMTMADVTEVEANVGDVVTVIGTDGTETLTLDGVATRAGLSPYELLNGLRSRLPHRYRGGEV
jgi:alanine racemase